MALTLCLNCRLPVHHARHRCHQCGVSRRTAVQTTLQVSLAAVAAVAATAIALTTRRVAV